MKKKILLFLSFNLVIISLAAQGPYSLSAVAESVKNKAAVVTHLENIELEVESIDKATVNVHRIYTVVNEDGREALFFSEYTSKYVSLDDVELKVFDATGRQIGKYKKKDMITQAMGEGLIEDGYVTFYYIRSSSYPVTVEVKYEQHIKSTLNIPAFRFIHPKEGVVESNFTARVIPEIGLRYKAKHTNIEPAVTEEGKFKVYKWTVKNLAPMEYEEGSVAAASRYPHVSIVPEKFSHYGFKGDLSSWASFGSWIKDLYVGLDALPADRQQFFQNLVKDVQGEKEITRRIYRYMQENFRYVSIQLGIGGLGPFSADFTDKKKYGDCKALSNYMKAALKSVGIESHVAIINAGYNQEPVDVSFPSNDFNHVILCVPGKKDSTWLECTSSTAEFGQLGSFTENRNALLITDKGGVLVATPKSHSTTNTLSALTKVDLRGDLSGLIETSFTAKGEFREVLSEILKERKDDQKKAIVFYFGSKQPDDFELSKTESKDGNETKLRMVISKIPEFSAGNKIFLSPRIYKMWPFKLPKSENRKLDYYFHHPFEKYDTTIFKLPAGVTPDALPAEKELNCEYASYRSKYWYDEKDNSVYAGTVLILKDHRIPATAYASVKKFFDDLMQDDTQKIVVKGTPADAPKKAF